MRGRRALALALALAVAPVMVAASSSDCSYCRYAAWNCSLTTEETSVLSTGDKGDLRKEGDAASTLQAVEVCNAEGKIQVDDVFCDANDCECASGRKCVSLVVGCQNIFQARSRKRCIGDAAIEQRFQQCAVASKLTVQAKTGLQTDWVQFKDHNSCGSKDCTVVSRFHKCGAVQCGYLIVVWKESDSEYRFIVDGSRARDMEAGTFMYTARTDAEDLCSSITSQQVPDCYALQTRNQKNGTCSGVYLQLDNKFQAGGQAYELSKLSWPVYIAVVGSVVAAVVSVASVLTIYLRFRRFRQEDELDDLLPDDQSESDCHTPHQDTTPAASDVRQRALSPKSQQQH